MSLFSRLFGKSPSAAGAAPVSERDAGVESPPRPDSSVRAREEEASLSQAIAAGDMVTIGKWVLEGSSTRIRQAAARNIADPEQLRQLIPATRHGKDKNVHRILTARRDEQLAEIRSAQQLQADLAETAAAIARHSERPYDPSYATILAQLETRWRTLAPQAKPDLQDDVAQRLERAHEAVEHHRRAIEQSIQAETERQRSAAFASEAARRQQDLEAQAAAAAAAEQAQADDAERQAVREAEQAQRAADEAKAHDILALLRQA
ncbi:MAG: hypothetical protein WBM03_17940, partial [Steroidobacteraceae bacterium]